MVDEARPVTKQSILKRESIQLITKSNKANEEESRIVSFIADTTHRPQEIKIEVQTKRREVMEIIDQITAKDADKTLLLQKAKEIVGENPI